MSFNPDPTKQAEQVILTVTVPHHKRIGLILDETLNFAEHTREAIIKARSSIGIIRFLSKYVHCDVLDQMYKLHVRLHLDYGVVVYRN